VTLVEAAVESLEEALGAERAGCGRIELCANLSEGGTTPDRELIAQAVAQCRIPVVVMVRPRGGDYVYSPAEIDIMLNQIAVVRSIGAAGIVTGALDPHDEIDVASMARLLSATQPLPLTFHRAFDRCANLPQALDELIGIGVSRVLTSGGAKTAGEGAGNLERLVRRARGRIAILAGGKIRTDNVAELVSQTGVAEVHSRYLDEASMGDLVRRAG
jgi:copper homeostasis protein CutC